MSTKPLPEIDDTSRPFWDAVQNEQLHLQHCGACDSWIFYPSRWCTACYSQDLTWRAASGTGAVWSFSVIHQAPYAAFEVDVPYILATIRLSEGVQMMTNLINCDIDQVTVGMAVQFTTETRTDGFKVPLFEPTS